MWSGTTYFVRGYINVRHYFSELASGFEWKTITSVIASIVMAIEGFYGELLWVFLGIVTIDFITGIMKSKKNGVPISSRKLRDSVSKVGAYMLLMTCIIITSKVEPVFSAIVTPVYWYFILTEFKSVLENVEEMGVKIPTLLSDLIKGKLHEIDKIDKDNKQEE